LWHRNGINRINSANRSLVSLNLCLSGNRKTVIEYWTVLASQVTQLFMSVRPLRSRRSAGFSLQFAGIRMRGTKQFSISNLSDFFVRLFVRLFARLFDLCLSFLSDYLSDFFARLFVWFFCLILCPIICPTFFVWLFCLIICPIKVKTELMSFLGF